MSFDQSTSGSKLDFAAKQRIYDENQKREKQFRSLFLQYNDQRPEYFLNPFRGKRNQAVSDPVGGARGGKFLDRDEAFLRSRAGTPGFDSRPPSSSSGQQYYAADSPSTTTEANQNDISATGVAATADNKRRGAQTPLPELAATRTPTPFQQHHPGISPAPNLQNNKNNAQQFGDNASFLDNERDSMKRGGIYDVTSSQGRSLLRMRLSNAVLKPRTQLHGEAIRFDSELKEASRPPQDRYGYPRTAAHSYGWFHDSLEKVDKQPREGVHTRMGTGNYFLAQGLLSTSKATQN